ncbi:AbrB/MazE/SpoVT family DNA-binding domain-containing protein [Candidatus Nomurabacteria bacterium]|jgi:AbrB family looped-hinge helix DNA binding protein|nr:AbrB/MazE/SpoVT family DNA-binding domain-containing protein [Candidatus Saccharibacteria bacterium]MCB9817329.1 AbrB/MazE/SpoVT family DNA-binding domain-containing protein [Candidatus Nomurabacteria bacterium]MCB9839997.1 AbrB/MazE/SpoVT family DNA-binding domain-containing protein [Candidatus Nomurabacteria bacterium]
MNMPQLIGSVTVGERGQVVIPSEARESMSINAGDKLLVFKAPVDGVLIIAKPETFEKLLAHLELNLPNKKKS